MANKRNLRHGGWLFLKRGEMPEGCEEIHRGIAKLAGDLADEFAGPGIALTASQAILIDRTCQLIGFLKLVERETWKKGPVVADETGSPKVAPTLGAFYISASNAVAKALRTLSEVSGRVESGKQAPDLKAYLLTKPDKQEKSPVEPDDVGATETEQPAAPESTVVGTDAESK